MTTQEQLYKCRYAKAFSFFERVSDERIQIAEILNAYLSQTLEHLEDYNLIDIGAGYGSLGRLINWKFRNRIAIEPNNYVIRHLAKYYDRVVPAKYHADFPLDRGDAIILLSQSLYFFNKAERREILTELITTLGNKSLLCVVADTFAGDFGQFLIRWLQAFGIEEQMILPSELFTVLDGMADLEVTFYHVRSRLSSASFFEFSRALSVYFDVRQPSWRVTNEQYRLDIYKFRKAHCFHAENMVGIWLIRRP